MKNFARTVLGLAAAAGTLASCSSEEKKPAQAAAPAPVQAAAPVSEAPLTVERSVQISVTAKVKAVNQVTREVTLTDSYGRATTFIAGPQVKRLSEVSVGDDVTAECVATLTAELRPPTADETANPISAVEIAGRSAKGTAPAGGTVLGVKVVTTVEAVDLPNMRVTLRGPMGDSTTVRARNPENVKRLHVGDTIVITYVEAMAISLVKAGK